MAGEIAHPLKRKIVNDPVHGHIDLPELCVQVIDTPQFQRLRAIRQLGGNYFVYPGVSHNRFEHSIGVCHLAGQMVKALQDNQPDLEIDGTDKLCVQVAGLCHDLGHGPFSHLFEAFVHEAQKKTNTEIQRKWKHEDMSVKMFDHLMEENEIKHALKPEDMTFIKEMIKAPAEGEYKGRPEKKFLYQIVANSKTGIDVDKWDYFARDCHGLGMGSMFDHNRLMKFARVIPDGKNDYDICFRDKEANNVYDMFHTRQVLHRRAYQHKTAVAIERMILDAMIAADEYILTEGKRKKYRISECIDDLTAYERLNDSIYYRILFSTKGSLEGARSILQRIEKRALYRLVGEAKPTTQPERPKTKTNDQMEEEIRSKSRSLDDDDIFVTTLKFDYGMKEKDPVESVKFYRKSNENKAISIPRGKVSFMLPEIFQDQVICCYSRRSEKFEEVKGCFETWCASEDSGVDIIGGQ